LPDAVGSDRSGQVGLRRCTSRTPVGLSGPPRRYPSVGRVSTEHSALPGVDSVSLVASAGDHESGWQSGVQSADRRGGVSCECATRWWLVRRERCFQQRRGGQRHLGHPPSKGLNEAAVCLRCRLRVPTARQSQSLRMTDMWAPKLLRSSSTFRNSFPAKPIMTSEQCLV
jgi:hypothetical protein